MKCIKTKKQEGGYSMTVKNKTLVANMQHVKFNEIPPLKGPDSQGLNVPLKQATTIKNSENINGRYRQALPNVETEIKIPSDEEVRSRTGNVEEQVGPDDIDITQEEDGSATINFDPAAVNQAGWRRSLETT